MEDSNCDFLCRSDMDMGRVHPWIGLSWVRLSHIFVFFCVGLDPKSKRHISVIRSLNCVMVRHALLLRLPPPHGCLVEMNWLDTRPSKFQLLVGIQSFGAIIHLTIRSCHRLRVVCISTSSAQSERYSSSAGHYMNTHRTRLSAHKMGITRTDATGNARWNADSHETFLLAS